MLTNIIQFFVASFVYYITSTIWPAKETFIEHGSTSSDVDEAVVEKGSESDKTSLEKQ